MAESTGKRNEKLHMTADISGEYLDIREISKLLAISRATAKNWIRLGKIKPDVGDALFSRSYAYRLQAELCSDENHQLKSRRNKSKATGRLLYKEYVRTRRNQIAVENILKADVIRTEQDLRSVLAYFALQLYGQSRGILCNRENILEYLTGQSLMENDKSDELEKNKDFSLGTHSEFLSLIADLTENLKLDSNQIEALAPVFKQELVFVQGEDTLGFVYLSLRDIGQRKRTGAYYTPEKIVRRMMDYLQDKGDFTPEKTFCDPCCGTGNFLLGLASRGVAVGKLYGQDLDSVSVCLTRINLALINPYFSTADLYSRIRCGNTLKEESGQKYSVILGNPPWGSVFDAEDAKYYRQKFRTAQGKKIESYDVFIEKALSMLLEEGTLSFVLPEAILNVASHDMIRRLLREKCSFGFVSYLGDVFSGVQCPAVILGVSLSASGLVEEDNNSSMKKMEGAGVSFIDVTDQCKASSFVNVAGCKVYFPDHSFTIEREREWADGIFSFHLSDEEEDCLEAIANIPDGVYLKNHARFALGIVTGNNQEFISEEKRDGYESILKGSDIQRYRILHPEHYIRYTPERFQQTASTDMYRAGEKLLYRFISSSPVFAYDDGGHLTLNSCNILIPEIPGLSIKYILAILNSRVISFYLQKKFRSVKLLRSHIEAIPIPMVSGNVQDMIVSIVDNIMKTPGDFSEIDEELDEQIFSLFSLTEKQIHIIKSHP